MTLIGLKLFSKVEKKPNGIDALGLSFTTKKEKMIPFNSSMSGKVEKIEEKGVVELLGEEIRNLGESLSQELCEKFISQLKARLKKTHLTPADIKKAASLYVIQRRKHSK